MASSRGTHLRGPTNAPRGLELTFVRPALRMAFVVCVLAVTCIACKQEGTVSQRSGGASAFTANCSGGSDFTNRIIVKNSSTAPTPAMIQDLGDAYCNASANFQHQLDGIDFVFLDGAVCGGNLNSCGTAIGSTAINSSWGQRKQGGYTNIGISGGLWTGQQSAEPYINYETDILLYLLHWSTSPIANFTYVPGSPGNSSWMTVLAALAHEVGHVRWFELNARSGFGHPYDFKRLNDCTFPFFSGWQSQGPKYLSRKDRWRNFGDTSNEAANEHAMAPLLNDFKTAANDLAKGSLLADLFYQDRPWASYLGANAPDEDFVETYKFLVLLDAGLSTMPITIPLAGGTSTTRDIPADFLVAGKKMKLQGKVQCIRRWI